MGFARSLFLLGMVFAFSVCYPQDEQKFCKSGLSAGFNMLIYQAPYAFKNTTGVEILYGRPLGGAFDWEAGIRLGLKPVRPEAFARLNISHTLGCWKPKIGVETGITNRMYFESDDKRGKEARDAMTGDMGHAYISTHTELLSFYFKKGWNASFIEIDIGTHYNHFGRTLRFQLTGITIGKTF